MVNIFINVRTFLCAVFHRIKRKILFHISKHKTKYDIYDPINISLFHDTCVDDIDIFSISLCSTSKRDKFSNNDIYFDYRNYLCILIELFVIDNNKHSYFTSISKTKIIPNPN